jgi:outer membrane protein assembly factor BamB
MRQMAMVAILVASVTTMARADNWPCWRGPSGDGLSAETDLPVEWGPSRNVAFKTPIPGRGHSSPIVWQDSVFLTSCIEDQKLRVLLRIDRNTGRVVWQREVLAAPLEPIHRLNSYSSSTPATDGKLVYVSFLDQNQMYAAAYDFAGNRVWEQRPGPFASRHGYCTCPVLYRDYVILNGDHDGDAYLVMLRKDTGAIVWKTPRENKTRSYCTPIIVPIDGRDQLMLNGSVCTAGYDVTTGKKIWTCDGPSEQMVATLVHRGDLIFSLGGYPERHLLAIKKGGVGDITKTHIVWRTHQSIPYVPSPLLYGDYLHVVADEGIYTCFDPPTGKVLARQRAAKHVSSSLVGAGGLVYLTDDTGRTVVFKNAPDFQVVAENQLGEECYSTPALSQGSLYIRGVRHLFRIAKTEANAAGQ